MRSEDVATETVCELETTERKTNTNHHQHQTGRHGNRRHVPAVVRRTDAVVEHGAVTIVAMDTLVAVQTVPGEH